MPNNNSWLTEFEDWPDEALVLEVQSGNIRAFEYIVRRYHARLFAFLRRMIQDEATVEEVVQDAFLNLYRTIDRVDTSQRFSTYLHAIAKHQAISTWRKMKDVVPLDAAEHIADDDPIEERLMKASDGEYVRRAISTLEEKYRHVLQLYYFDTLNYEEIQRVMHLPLNTVRTHLRRAKELLRRELDHTHD